MHDQTHVKQSHYFILPELASKDYFAIFEQVCQLYAFLPKKNSRFIPVCHAFASGELLYPGVTIVILLSLPILCIHLSCL